MTGCASGPPPRADYLPWALTMPHMYSSDGAGDCGDQMARKLLAFKHAGDRSEAEVALGGPGVLPRRCFECGGVAAVRDGSCFWVLDGRGVAFGDVFVSTRA